MKKTILLVDDEPEILKVIGHQLESFGYAVIPQTSAETALSLIRQGTRADLVITDLRMPGMDGIEFVTTLKEALPSVPVIVLTAHGGVETFLESVSRGVFEYINKPVEKNELCRIVKAALEKSETGSTSPG